MAKIRLPLLVLLAALVGAVLVPLAPAGADDPRSQRDKARDRKAQLARQLDGLEASEEELVQALEALNAQVRAQSARVAAARQAVAAAEAELDQARRQLEATRAEIASVSQALVDQAVRSFIQPGGESFQSFVESSDITEVTRKQALLGQVVATEDDLVDALKAAREDLEIAEAAAQDAAAKAADRRQVAEGELAVLARDRDAKARVKADVDRRQREVLSEIDALAAQESRLTRLIREREAAAARAAAQRSTASPDLRSGSGGCIWPTRGVVTSEYGYRWGRLHAGIDISAPTGTPIWAAKGGVVIFSGVMSGYGNVVVVDHGGGFSTLYAHQSRIAARDGQSVSQGQTIGYVGSTGRSTGPHLHFETRYGGTASNPRGCLP